MGNLPHGQGICRGAAEWQHPTEPTLSCRSATAAHLHATVPNSGASLHEMLRNSFLNQKHAVAKNAFLVSYVQGTELTIQDR